MKQTAETIKFIEAVKNLKKSGDVKNYATIIEALDWDKTTFSNVLNGRKNVPDYIFTKFNEVYRPIEVNNSDVLRLEGIIKIDAKCDVILSTLAEVLATQRGQATAKISGDLVTMVNDRIKERLNKL